MPEAQEEQTPPLQALADLQPPGSAAKQRETSQEQRANFVDITELLFSIATDTRRTRKDRLTIMAMVIDANRRIP